MAVPRYDQLFNPLLAGLKRLGGSGSIPEIEDAVAAEMNLREEEIETIHKGNRTKFSYNLAWARTYLKNFGFLENSRRGVWALTEKGLEAKSVDPDEVKRFVHELFRQDREEGEEEETEAIEQVIEFRELRWQDKALEALKLMAPAAFERLCQRLLREAGFIQVEVTGKTGDGGIDGKGIVKLGGIVSFHVIFQCKRYRDSVPSSVIRDFRGAMVGRADKGLFLTTGSFTRDARMEAQRDGAPPLDLIDGEELVKMLKDMRLGIEVREKKVEEVLVNEEWFKSI